MLPKENIDDEVKFFQTQEFHSIQMQTSTQRFLDQCKHNIRYSKLSVHSKQSSKLSPSSQHTLHKTKLSSKPSRRTHSFSSTSSSVKSSLEKERALFLVTQAEEIYHQKLKQIENEKRILELEKEKELNRLIEVRHKVELAEFDFELENKSVTSYDNQSQHNFQREIHQKPVVRSGSDHLANSLQNMSLKDHRNNIHHYNQVLPYSNLKQTSQSDTYLIHLDKHSKHIVENSLHPDKSAMSKTPSMISRIVKDPVDRFIELLVEGE